ncbi:hypothetical protein BDR03DRAFT_1017338 [Suillus americanus]|nr:hypothetical protein BDR03DRAFT_1017338 [Suillus americanus]
MHKRSRANTAGDTLLATPESLLRSIASITLEARNNLGTNPNLDPFALVLLDGCEDADLALYPDDSNHKASETYREHSFSKTHPQYIATATGYDLILLPNGNFHPTAPGAEFSRTSFTHHNFDSLEKDIKKGINYILGEIIKYWPCMDDEEVEKHRLSLVTGYSFYQEILRLHLQRFKNLELHGKHVSPLDHRAAGTFGFVKLWDIFEGGTRILGPERTALMDQILSMFFQLAQKHLADTAPAPSVAFSQVKAIPVEIRTAIEDSKTQRNEIAIAQYLGELAYRNAEWIGVPGDVTTTMRNKIVVESQEILELGLSSNAFKPEDIILVDGSWMRIKKPNNGQHRSVILWAKDHVNDTNPTEAKIFGAVIYNAHEETSFASEHTQERVQLEMRAMMHDIRTRENCKRGMMNYGTLVKSSLGMAVTNGLLNQPEIQVAKIHENAQARTIVKHQVQSSLRISIQTARPVIQACNFAFLQGFLPHFAKEQLAKATEAHLLNRYGVPNTQAFASYGYCAAMHTDRDDSVTVGWISARSHKVLDDESNFVYAEFKIILELDVNTHFIWNAPNDLHGTTMNRVFSKQPKSWKTFTRTLANADLAQWSRANVLTHNAVSSGLKSGGDQ